MRILITGGCGFVGSNLCVSIKKRHQDYSVVALDNLKRRGSELNINRLKETNVDFIHGDVRSIDDFTEVGHIDVLIDASAEPSVLAGIDAPPNYLINTNYNGTVNCLNYAKRYNAKFIFLSTSRVYSIPTLEQINYQEGDTRFLLSSEQNCLGASDKGFNEDFPTSGYRSLYGSTKLASELLVEEYQNLFGLETIINRCGVMTGPHQMGKVDQGIVVLWMARHFWPRSLNYIGFGGTGKQVRDVMHIDDLVDLLDDQMLNFNIYNGQTFNVGGGQDVSTSLVELTHLCEEITGNSIEIKSVPKNRPADIPIYISDCSKLERLAGWKPQRDVHSVLGDIHEWFIRDEYKLKPILS